MTKVAHLHGPPCTDYAVLEFNFHTHGLSSPLSDNCIDFW